MDGSAGEDPDEIGGEVYFDDNDLIEDESDDDETESSIDLFIRFFQSMFKKISKRAKKASRSILPSVISPQLVGLLALGFSHPAINIGRYLRLNFVLSTCLWLGIAIARNPPLCVFL